MRPQPFGQVARDRRDGAAVIHELAEQPAEQEQGQPSPNEARRTPHEGLRPMGEERLARQRGNHECSRRGRQQYAPPAKGQPHQQGEREQYPDESHTSTLHHPIRRATRSNTDLPAARGGRAHQVRVLYRVSQGSRTSAWGRGRSTREAREGPRARSSSSPPRAGATCTRSAVTAPGSPHQRMQVSPDWRRKTERRMCVPADGSSSGNGPPMKRLAAASAPPKYQPASSAVQGPSHRKRSR